MSDATVIRSDTRGSSRAPPGCIPAVPPGESIDLATAGWTPRARITRTTITIRDASGLIPVERSRDYGQLGADSNLGTLLHRGAVSGNTMLATSQPAAAIRAGRLAQLGLNLESVPCAYRGPAPANMEASLVSFNYDRTIPRRWTVVSSLPAIKVLAALAILIVGLVGGAIPILATRHHASHRILSLSNALAGGIFLGAGFLHLLPEASEALGDVIEYPLAPLMAAIGVCMLLLIDRVLFEAVQAGTRTQGDKAREPIYPVVLLVVLSIHSVIAGVALGIEAELAASLLVMIAILCHKGSAAFALVVSLIAAGTGDRRVWRALAVFVAMTPLGIGIGTGASSLLQGPEATLIKGSLTALAAGTFIYVAILDVISAEMSTIDDRRAHYVRSALVGQDDVPMPLRDADRAFKFLLVVIGLACMAVLGVWV